MKIIIGLGNPGVQYENTRHNVGFSALNVLASKYGYSFKKKFLKPYEYIDLGKSLLVKPLTFMNNSGQVMKFLKNDYDNTSDIMVICDNLDLPCGAVRIRVGGADSGQKGLRNICSVIGNSDFYRVYIGIGRPLLKEEVNSYVLSREIREEYASELNLAINNASSVALDFMEGSSLSKLQNEYTRKGIL